jgi:hypothetical protein
LLTQVTNARFNPHAGFSRYYLNSGNELVARMSPAVCPGNRDGRASSLFLFNSGSELVARLSVVVCLGKREGIGSWLFLLNGSKQLVAKINHVVCPGKRGGRASSLFRINGNLGRPRTFRASFALRGLHSDTILAQRVQTAEHYA